MKFEGPCSAPKLINIEIQGTILGSIDLSLYKGDRWITIKDVDGVVLIGEGTLNGQGEALWHYETPSGSSELGNLPDVLDSTNVTISGLNITAPEKSPNTDGVHLSGSQTVTLTNCVIGTSDDCISVGDGNINVNISKIFCGPGHGISIGSLGKRQGETDVKGNTVTNCALTGTTNGARIKTWHDSPVLEASNIGYEDLVMTALKNPIIIDQNYYSSGRVAPSKVKIVDVHFRNIRGTSFRGPSGHQFQ